MGKQDDKNKMTGGDDGGMPTEIQRNSNYDSVLRRNEARSNTIKKWNQDEDQVMRE